MGNQYKNNKIIKFILRLDFVSEIEELKSNIPDKIAEKVKSVFPIFNERNLIETSVIFKNDVMSKTDKKTIEWSYTDTEGKNTIIISPRYIIFDSEEYKSFDDVKEKIIQVIEEIFNLKNVQIKRTGIRYVNLFECKDYNIEDNREWASYLKKELLNAQIFGDLNDKIAQTINTIDFFSGSHMIKLKSGFKNNKYPITGNVYDFVLDCDGYTMSVITNTQDLSEMVDEIHNDIETIFENCIEQKMRDKLNG